MRLNSNAFCVTKSSDSALQTSGLQKSDRPGFAEQQNTIPLWVLILKAKHKDKNDLIPTILIVDAHVLTRYLSLFKYTPNFLKQNYK